MGKKVKMILTNGFGPDVRVYKEAKYLLSMGYDVEILCWDRERQFVEEEKIDRIKIKRFFTAAKYGTGYRQLFPYFAFIRECKRYLRGKDIDYLHCHDLDGIIVGWFMKKGNTRLIFDMHEFYEGRSARKQKLRRIIRAIVSSFQTKSDYIIYVNDVQVASMSKPNRRKLVYLPNYPDWSAYENSCKTQSQKLRISYIGAVRQYEQLRNLFEACKGMDDVEIAVHGDGVAYEPLKLMEKKYANVNVTGRYHFTQSAQLYGDADVSYVIYPTTSERYLVGYPIKFFEAIITKTPPVVGEGTVLADFVREKDIGFVVNGNDINSIRNLVEILRANRETLKQKTVNLEKIQFQYSWEEVVTNLEQIYG